MPVGRPPSHFSGGRAVLMAEILRLQELVEKQERTIEELSRKFDQLNSAIGLRYRLPKEKELT